MRNNDDEILVVVKSLDEFSPEERKLIETHLPEGRPIDIDTGEEMTEEQAAELRVAMHGVEIIIPDEMKAQLEAAGVTEDVIRAMLLKSVRGLS